MLDIVGDIRLIFDVLLIKMKLRWVKGMVGVIVIYVIVSL